MDLANSQLEYSFPITGELHETVEEGRRDFFSGSGSIGKDYYLIRATGNAVPSPSDPNKNHSKAMQLTIMETFSLTAEQLAESIKVTRKTLYNYRSLNYEGSRNKKATKRLFSLYRAALNWRGAGLVASKNLLAEPLVKGNSLLDLLKADIIDQEAILFLGQRLNINQLGGSSLKDPFA